MVCVTLLKGSSEMGGRQRPRLWHWWCWVAVLGAAVGGRSGGVVGVEAAGRGIGGQVDDAAPRRSNYASSNHGAPPPAHPRSPVPPAAGEDVVGSGRPRIAILSCYFGSSMALAPLTKPNKLAYAEHHGYHFEDAMESSEFVRSRFGNLTAKSGRAEGVGLPADHSDAYILLLFMKLEILLHYQELWRHRFDWIFWSDADALFLNFSESLDRHVRDVPAVTHLIIPGGHNTSPKWSKVLNTGHFFLRLSPWSLVLMQATLRHSREPCDPTIPAFNGWINPCMTQCCVWGDQGALMQVLMKQPSLLRHVRLTGFRDFGSQFPYYETTDLVVHLPGMDVKQRVRMLSIWVESINFATGTIKTGKPLPDDMKPQPKADHARNMDYGWLNNLTTWQTDNQHLAYLANDNGGNLS